MVRIEYTLTVEGAPLGKGNLWCVVESSPIVPHRGEFVEVVVSDTAQTRVLAAQNITYSLDGTEAQVALGAVVPGDEAVADWLLAHGWSPDTDR